MYFVFYIYFLKCFCSHLSLFRFHLLGSCITSDGKLDLSSVCLSRYHYLRGLVNTVSNRRLDALDDFQSLYKTDAEIFPSQMVKSLVDSLPDSERLQVSLSYHKWHTALLSVFLGWQRCAQHLECLLTKRYNCQYLILQ